MGAHRSGRRPEVGAGALTGAETPAQQGRLLDLGDETAPTEPPPDAPEVPGRVVRVLPDVAAIDKLFDYVVPEAWEHDGRAEAVTVGTQVRIELHGRRVGGWVVDVDVDPPPGVELRPLATFTGHGPDPDVVELCRWVASRWGGRLARVLVSASPPKAIKRRPPRRSATVVAESIGPGVAKAFEKDVAVVRLPPSADPFPVLQEAARLGNALIVTPSLDAARVLGARLRRAGAPVAVVPRDWTDALAGASVIGARSAVLAPVVDLAAVVVVDEHDEALQEERNPTWHARDVAIERAARHGVPCVLLSPVPTLHALELGPVLRPSRATEREGWPQLHVIDRHGDDPVRGGLLSDQLTEVLRGPGPVVCVLNRKGRSRRLACARCGEVAWHEDCSVPFEQTDDGRLRCPTCAEDRPLVCEKCGSTSFKNLRAGVTRIREELEALARRPVQEITAATDDEPITAEVIVGTEAALHRLTEAHAVVFLDIDQELLARRYRAAEQALTLLARASRLVGGRADGGRVVVQTRMPDHPVIDAVRRADPGRLVEDERRHRRDLRLPPAVAMAELSGAGAAAFARALGGVPGIEVLGPLDDRFLVKAHKPADLAVALETTPRPEERLRVAVDPPRV